MLLLKLFKVNSCIYFYEVYKFTPSGCINGKVQRLDDGRVNVCFGQEWKTVCEKGYQWRAYQANIACRLLGYNNNGTFFSIICFASSLCPTGAIVRRSCFRSTRLNYIDVSECSAIENTFEECGINQRDFGDCRGCKSGTQKIHPKIVCLSGKYFVKNS